jgi:hypothetical protein
MPTVSIRHDVGGPDGVLGHLLPFESHGAMRAVPYAPSSTGRLDPHWRWRYQDDQNAPGIVYTVVSYQTPIAWVRADGRMVMPPVTYSATTTRHQNLCRTWMGYAPAASVSPKVAA